MRAQPDVIHMRVGAAMLDQKVGNAFDRERTYLPDVRRIIEHAGSKDLIELKRLIDELEGSNQHSVKGSRFASRIKSRGFLGVPVAVATIVREQPGGGVRSSNKRPPAPPAADPPRGQCHLPEGSGRR